MAKKKPHPNQPVKPTSNYTSLSGDEVKQKAMASLDSAVAHYRGCNKDWQGYDGCISGRSEFGMQEYNFFRPNEAIPRKHRDIMAACDQVYYEVGIIRNIIDLMGDFTCQGIRLSHPNKKIQRFYRRWFNKVKGKEISERFANYLYRFANIIIQRELAKIPKAERDRLSKATTFKQQPRKKNVIPLHYNMVNPATVKQVGGSSSLMAHDREFAIVYPMYYANKMGISCEDNCNSLLQKTIDKGGVLPLDKKNTLVFHYKKDDWRCWSRPILYSVLSDIRMLKKLELADLAALDGAISNIRIFKLGSLEHEIAPGEPALKALDDILQSNVGGGTMDIIWGPDIELIESKTSIHQFLGKEKYVPHMDKIFQGLGIPVSLAGGSQSTGATNNFISLKTLLQRLEYGREVLNNFWEQEIELVRQAMGWAKPAIIEYDVPNLTDDVSYKSLLIQLADRNLISDELLQLAFKNDPQMEQVRINRDESEREKGKRVRKRTSLSDGDFEQQLLKIAYQSGYINLDQVNIKLPDSESETPAEQKMKMQEEKMKGQPGEGRPKNSLDKEQRKTRTFKPVGSLERQLFAMSKIKEISDVLKPYILKVFKKKNLRSLTADETEKYEKIQFGVLFNFQDGDDVIDLVAEKIDVAEYQKYMNICKDMEKHTGQDLSNDERNYIKATLFALKGV